MYKVNEMRMPTWSSQGLNYIEYRPEILWSKDYYVESSKEKNNDVEDSFKNKVYGLSEDILKENKEYRNLDIYRQAEGKIETEFINLNLDDKYNQLVSRIDISAKEGSKSSYLVSFTSDNTSDIILNSLIRLKLEKDSELKLVVITNLKEKSTNLQSIGSLIGENAKLDLSYIEIGAEKSLVSIKNHLLGNNASLEESGIYFKQNDEFLDLLAVNEHSAEITKSNSMFNGALKDRAVKNWKGIVDLRKGCVHADGKIGDYSMMLSEDVVNKTAPILLNEEKEVSGTHAASVGRLNKDMLYYIMSRGFDKKKAQSLMLEANFAPTLDKIEDQKLRDELKDKVHQMNTRD